MVASRTEIVNRASALEWKRVVTADGRYLGRLFDLRCQWNPESGGSPIVDQVVFGNSGLLERVGLRRVQPRFVHWYLVESLEETKVVVSATKR